MTRPQLPRPALNSIPLVDALASLRGFDGLGNNVTVTISAGQWDSLSATAYGMGCLILELDDRETPIAAYRKQP